MDGRAKPSRVVHGGAALVWPLIQDYAYISLKPMPINIDLKGHYPFRILELTFQVHLQLVLAKNPPSWPMLAERLLGFKIPEIEKLAEEIILGQLRLTVASLTIEQINQDRDAFLSLITQNVDQELRKFGLTQLNVNIVDITDESDYIESIGKKAANNGC